MTEKMKFLLRLTRGWRVLVISKRKWTQRSYRNDV